MGDHFVLLVDRLITESTLEAVIESRNRAIQSTILAVEKPKNDDVSSSPKKSVECKICHDDDDYSNMESPCSCSGSLKYAHRRCVQRWCNEKGNTMCEICHQQFKPGYTVPQLFRLGQIPMHFRGNWEVSRRDTNSPRIIAMVSTEFNNNSDDTDHNNDTSLSNSRTLTCCRSLAIIVISLFSLFSLTLLVNNYLEM